MATDNNYEEILEEVCEKLNNIDSVKEIDVLDIKNSVEEIENLITDTQAKLNFEEIKEKLETIALQVDSCNDALLKDLYTDINALKDSTNSVSQHIENLQNVQNLALTSAEFEEFQKQQLDLALKTNENIFNELAAIKDGTSSANSENIKNLEVQLQNLHENLSAYIEQMTSKLEDIPSLESIGSVVSDLNSVQSKSIKQTNVLIKDLQTKFAALQEENKNKDFENQIAKISEIYDSLSIIRAWIDKVGNINQSLENVYARFGENIDFDELAEKVDIIYESISSLNSWTMKIDNVDSSMSELQSKLAPLPNFMLDAKNITNAIQAMKEKVDASLTEDVDFEDLSNKMDIVYDNLSAINEWANKVDTINEKVSTINEAFEDEMVASKVDLIYENISLLNEWVSKIDVLDNKYTETNGNLNDKIDEITETLSKASEIISDVPDLKDRLEELSNELHTITSTTKNDADSYIYTLLDIESDFLKLHKFVDDKTQVTTNDINSLKEHISELNDDISSISIRTNKLILAADDANKEFKTYLDTFKTTIHALDVQRQQFNPELKFTFLSEKINEMAKLLHNSINASRNLNNAFLYLAEWIDASGSLLNTMQTDIATIKDNKENTASTSELEIELKTEIKALANKIDDIQDLVTNNSSADISEIKSMLTGVMVQLNTALTPVNIDSLNEKIDNLLEANANKLTELESLMQEKINQQSKQILSLEEKIEALDTKFDKLITTLAEDQKQFEIKDALQFIATQIAATNETLAQDPTAKMVKEVSDKMASFDTNINKIVSYIEED